jgi:hypothetical protein
MYALSATSKALYAIDLNTGGGLNFVYSGANSGAITSKLLKRSVITSTQPLYGLTAYSGVLYTSTTTASSTAAGVYLAKITAPGYPASTAITSTTVNGVTTHTAATVAITPTMMSTTNPIPVKSLYTPPSSGVSYGSNNLRIMFASGGWFVYWLDLSSRLFYKSTLGVTASVVSTGVTAPANTLIFDLGHDSAGTTSYVFTASATKADTPVSPAM